MDRRARRTDDAGGSEGDEGDRHRTGPPEATADAGLWPSLAMVMPDSGTRRVLFVCAGNTCRSPMAEAVAQRLLGEGIHVESAGITADEDAPATKDAVLVMNERGLDISAHRSRSLSAVNLLHFDLVIALTPAIAQVLHGQGADASKVRMLDIPDPYGRGIDAYRATAVAIERALQRLFDLSPEEPRQE